MSVLQMSNMVVFRNMYKAQLSVDSYVAKLFYVLYVKCSRKSPLPLTRNKIKTIFIRSRSCAVIEGWNGINNS